MDVNSSAKWTDDDERKLLEMRAAGASDRAIASALKRSVAAIEQHRYILRDRGGSSD